MAAQRLPGAGRIGVGRIGSFGDASCFGKYTTGSTPRRTPRASRSTSSATTRPLRRAIARSSAAGISAPSRRAGARPRPSRARSVGVRCTAKSSRFRRSPAASSRPRATLPRAGAVSARAVSLARRS
eukprot:30828-Pelagococcus_subviridis.AAC.7